MPKVPDRSRSLLGLNLAIEANKRIAGFKAACEPHFLWVQEIVVEAKKAFAVPEVQLLPKTPSSNRTRGKSNKSTSDGMTTRKTRSSQRKKPVVLSEDSTSSEDGPVLSMSRLENQVAPEDPEHCNQMESCKVPCESSTTHVESCNLSSSGSSSDSDMVFNGTPTHDSCERASHEQQQADDICPPTPQDNHDQQATLTNKRIITGFSLLTNVKDKAQAYEQHVSLNSSVIEVGNALSASGRVLDCTLTPQSGSAISAVGGLLTGRVGQIQAELEAKTSKMKSNQKKSRLMYKTTDSKRRISGAAARGLPANTATRMSLNQNRKSVNKHHARNSSNFTKETTDEKRRISGGYPARTLSQKRKSINRYLARNSNNFTKQKEIVMNTAPVNHTRPKTRLQLQQQTRDSVVYNKYPKITPTTAPRSFPVRSFLTPSQKQPASLLHNSVVTTPRAMSFKEKMEVRRKEMEEKDKSAALRVLKKQEGAMKRVEEQRRRREERQMLASQRREEYMKKDLEVKMTKINDKSTSTTMKFNAEEKRKLAKLRDKRLADVELKKKKDDELRRLRLLDLENEQKSYEELARLRELKETDRQQKLVEQRRCDEEKRQEMEMERQREVEKRRKEQMQKEKEEIEKKKQRDEKDRIERAERERIEIEKQRGKERLRREQLDKEREQEQQRIKAMEIARVQDEEKRAKAAAALKLKRQSTSRYNSSANISADLNGTLTSAHPDSYEITPKRVHMKSDSNNYNIDDLNSEDSTDEDDRPRKPIPLWASGSRFKTSLINQYYNPPNLERLFPECDPPDLTKIFTKMKPRFYKRTSSAIWDTPPITSHYPNLKPNATNAYESD